MQPAMDATCIQRSRVKLALRGFKTLSHLRLITLIHSLHEKQVAIPFCHVLKFHLVVGIIGSVGKSDISYRAGAGT